MECLYKPISNYIIRFFVPVDIPENYFKCKPPVLVIELPLEFWFLRNTAINNVVNIFQYFATFFNMLAGGNTFGQLVLMLSFMLILLIIIRNA